MKTLDYTDIIDIIVEAKETWAVANPQCTEPTTERTDECINKALGLPASGSVGELEFDLRGWTEADIISAVYAGMDKWLAELPPPGLLTSYSAPPSRTAFSVASLERLQEIRKAIDEAEASAQQTEWSKSAWSCDDRTCSIALDKARNSARILVAEDEDGWYFAEAV